MRRAGASGAKKGARYKTGVAPRKGVAAARPKRVFRKDDNLQVISGPAKGKVGRFKAFLPKTNSVLIDGVNMGFKHFKPSPDSGQSGGRREAERPVHVSSVMLICPACGRPSRVRHRLAESARGDKVKTVRIRVCARCGKDMVR
jgi:large subunit ribosomal protein L24